MIRVACSRNAAIRGHLGRLASLRKFHAHVAETAKICWDNSAWLVKRSTVDEAVPVARDLGAWGPNYGNPLGIHSKRIVVPNMDFKFIPSDQFGSSDLDGYIGFEIFFILLVPLVMQVQPVKADAQRPGRNKFRIADFHSIPLTQFASRIMAGRRLPVQTIMRGRIYP